MKLVTNAPGEYIIEHFPGIYEKIMVYTEQMDTEIIGSDRIVAQIGFVLMQKGWEIKKYH